MESVPKTLNWVKARAECSIDHLFETLVQVIDSDVKTIQSYDSLRRYVFQFNRVNEWKVIVSRTSPSVERASRSVVFERGASEIAATAYNARGERNELFTARPSFDAAGACRLEIRNQPLELWQVSRKALEDLFFS